MYRSILLNLTCSINGKNTNQEEKQKESFITDVLYICIFIKYNYNEKHKSLFEYIFIQNFRLRQDNETKLIFKSRTAGLSSEYCSKTKELSLPYYLFIVGKRDRLFFKNTNAKLNVNSLIQDLNSTCQLHFL